MQMQFLHGIIRGNESQHNVRKCVVVRQDNAKVAEKVFDAERTDNPPRHLSESRYADHIFFSYLQMFQRRRSHLCMSV